MKKHRGSTLFSDKKALLFYICIVTLPCIQFIIFWVSANFNSFFLAFQRYDPLTDKFVWYGWGNLDRFWNDLCNPNSMFRDALYNSLIVYVLTTAIGGLVNMIFALYIAKKRVGGGIFKILLFLPQILSSIVMCTLYKYFTDQAIPAMFYKMGFTEFPMLLTEQRTIMPVLIMYTFIFGYTNILINISVITRIPDSVLEYSTLDGITPMQELIYITYPLTFPTVAIFFVMGIPGIFTNQLNIYNVFGASPPYPEVTSIGYFLFKKVAGSSGSLGEFPYAAAGGFMCTIVAIPLVFIGRYFTSKICRDIEF